jgi:mRNA interferase RelE/StbE
VSEPYSVVYDPAAWRELMKLPQATQERILTAIEGLEVEPRPRGVKKLSGSENYYRIRIGQYRVLYEIRDAVLLVLILTVGNRRDVYR